MTHRIERWARVLGLLLLLCGCEAIPDDGVDRGHRVTGALGAAWTGDLQDPRTALTNAAVDPWAFAWQLGYEYVPIDQEGPVAWGFALDYSAAVGDVDSSRTSAGFLASEEGGSMSWSRFTPGVTARFPLGSRDLVSRSVVASAGLGYYAVEVEALQTHALFLATGSRELMDDQGLGGYLGLGYESVVPGSGGWFVEAEAHFFDFDPGAQYPSGTGAVRGPLVTLWMGFVASF